MSDLEHIDAVDKGRYLLSLIDAANQKYGFFLNREQQCLAPSVFTSYADLEKYGYMEEVPMEPFTLAPLRDCLRGLGVDDRLATCGGENEIVHHVHVENRIIDGVLYPATQAYFSQIINLKEGILVAHSNHSPTYMSLIQDPPAPNIPLLHHWSDIAFIQLLKPPLSSPLNLNYIIRYSIQNMATISVIRHILTTTGTEVLPIWPGITYSMNSEEGQAILSTPNGSGVAWMLAQHRKQLGRKKVDKVTVFYAQGKGDLYRWPSLVFCLKDGEDEVREYDEIDVAPDEEEEIGVAQTPWSVLDGCDDLQP